MSRPGWENTPDSGFRTAGERDSLSKIINLRFAAGNIEDHKSAIRSQKHGESQLAIRRWQLYDWDSGILVFFGNFKE